MKKITVKNISQCAILTALMFMAGFISVLISNIREKNVFQIADGIYLSLICYINPYISILSSIFSGILIDIYSSGFIYIPITILVKLLIGLTFLLLKKYINVYINITISYTWVFIYILYSYIIYDYSIVILESIIDSIQYIVTIILASILTFTFKKIKLEKIL